MNKRVPLIMLVIALLSIILIALLINFPSTPSLSPSRNYNEGKYGESTYGSFEYPAQNITHTLNDSQENPEYLPDEKPETNYQNKQNASFLPPSTQDTKAIFVLIIIIIIIFILVLIYILFTLMPKKQ